MGYSVRNAVPLPRRVRGREPVLLRLELLPVDVRLRRLRCLRRLWRLGVRQPVLLRRLRLPLRLLLVSEHGSWVAARSNAAVAHVASGGAGLASSLGPAPDPETSAKK